MNRKKISMLLASLMIVLSTMTPKTVHADTFDNGKMWYNVNYGGTAFDIKGYYNNYLYRTSYNDNGYSATLYADGRNYPINLDFPSNGSTISCNGMAITLNIKPISGGNYLKIEYIIRNDNSTQQRISLSTDADIKIGDNDCAPIYNLDGNTGFRMTDGNAQFMFIGRNSYGVTDVDYYWFGRYGDRTSNRFNQNYGSVSGIDSGMAFTWADRTFAPGETKVFSALMGVGQLNYPPSLSVISNVNRPYYAGEVVPISGIVNDRDGGDSVNIKYALDDGTEYTMPQTFNPNGNPTNFTTNFVVPQTTRGTHNLKIWAVDSQGNMSAPVSVNVDVAVDSTPPTGTHTVSTTNWTSGDVNIQVVASDSEQGVKGIILPNGAYSNGNVANFTATSNGAYTFVLEDNVGNKSNYVVNIGNIDKSAPNLSLSKNTENWAKPVVINATASDVGSGVKRIKLPDGNYIYSTNTTYVPATNGEYTFQVEDNVGLVTTQKINVTNIDEYKPDLTLSPSTTNWTNNPVTITATGTDAQTGVKRIQLPDGTWVNGGTATFSAKDNGTYNFTVEDNAGNTVIKSISINNIDKVNPSIVNAKVENLTKDGYDVIVTGVGDDKSGIDRVQFPTWTEANGQDDIDRSWTNSGFSKGQDLGNGTWKYHVDRNSHNGEYGNYITHIYAYDKAGNYSASGVRANLDNIAPNLDLTQSTSNWTKDSIIITAKASDSDSGVKGIILPDGTYVNGAEAKFSVNKNGSYSFIAEDNMGNKTTKIINITNMDDQAPIINLSSNPAQNQWTKGNVVVRVEATDIGVGVESIKLPNGNISYSDTFDYLVSENGTYSFTVVDKAGNSSTKSFTVNNIDRQAPTTPTISTNQNWTNAQQVPVTITAGTDTQSGIKGIQYKLSGSTETGWLVYKGVFNITNEGTTTITARTVDNVDLYSSEVTAQVKIDRTAPENNDITIVPIKK